MKNGLMLESIEKAWEKARVVDGFDPNIFRQDACGAWIQKEMFSQSGSMFGWGVDLIFPLSMGGSPIEDNIRALNYRNLVSKGNDYPSYKAVYTADGLENKETELYLTVNKITRIKLKNFFKNA